MTCHTLDARYLLCPLPVIRTQNKIKDLGNGDLLMVTCTDPGAINDIPMWCRINGHKVIGTATIGNEITITIAVNQN
jgi:tRNA 2-thiouridine synthesizing protein A